MPELAFLDCSNWAPSSFGGFLRLLLRHYDGATYSLLQGHGPSCFLEDECRI
jgi:hypothetical protein